MPPIPPHAARTSKAPPTAIKTGRPPADLNSDILVPFPAFAEAMKGQPDEVWTTLIKQAHGRERHTFREWLKLIDGHRNDRA